MLIVTLPVLGVATYSLFPGCRASPPVQYHQCILHFTDTPALGEFTLAIPARPLIIH